MGLYYNGKKVRNIYYNGKCITRLALGKEMTRLVEGDDFVRAEWLRAEIDTVGIMMQLPINSYNLQFRKRRIEGINYTYFTTNGYSYYYEGSISHFSIYRASPPLVIWRNSDISEDVMIDCSPTAILINGIDYNIPYYGFPIEFVKIQSAHSNGMKNLTSSITVDGVERYIPCRLLRPIPATLDGNGIARNAGECGMFDAVSGKFFGNVATSGAFTVEPSLVEGVDYEVHRWLKTGSGTPYIQVDDTCNTDGNAYIETTYKCNYSNGGFDMAIGFSINQNNNIGIRIFNSVYGTFVDYHKTENGVLSSYRVVQSQSNINAERYIKATLNNLIIDTTEYQSIAWGSGFDSVNYPNTRLLANQDNNNVMYKRTKIRVNSKEFDLVPVRLLRPLPSYLDANGKARHQYECGMLDLKKMTFYGNVASSGTFTVSDY